MGQTGISQAPADLSFPHTTLEIANGAKIDPMVFWDGGRGRPSKQNAVKHCGTLGVV